MSSDSFPLDPYRSPALPEGPYAGKPRSGRPGWLTALCVICIVLGALGLMNAGFGAVGAVFAEQMQRALQPRGNTPGISPELQQAQEDFQNEALAVQRKHLWKNVASLVFRTVAALLLLIGGLRCLGLSEGGRRLLLIACAVGLAFELVNAIIQTYVALDMMTAMNSFAEKLQSAMPDANAPPGMNQMLKMWFRVVMIFQIVMLYALSVLKGGLYLFGLLYLQRAHIKALFK